MKKSIQNKLMVLFVVLIFGMSTIAYVFTSATGFGTPDEVSTLDNFIIEGDVDPNVEFEYTQNGYTFLKYYYKEGPLLSYVESLPSLFTTNTGQTQLFVVKIPAETESITISNLNGVQEVEDLSATAVFVLLCEYIIVTPAECMLSQFNTSQ